MTSTTKAYRASILHYLRDPGENNDASAQQYFADGIMLVENGKVAKLGSAEELLPGLSPGIQLDDYSGKLIIPGLIDTHVHYPQTDIIASYGEDLLHWLNTYTFPTEGQFGDEEHASEVAEFFLAELLRNGTTTALVLATVHPQSVDAIFNAAKKRNMRMLAGKVMMDRHAPDYLLDTPASSYEDSAALIEKWHHTDRLHYAITPRFAPTSSEAQFEMVAKLAQEYPDAYLHSHVAENKKEIEWVKNLFPWSRSYLDVYDHYGLLRERAVYAHGIYLDKTDRQRMSNTGSSIAFCPTSNTFLGSGLFDCLQALDDGIRVSIATDVGGGTSFSLIQTLAEAYKVQQLNGKQLSPGRSMYLATLGNAKALYLDDKIGNFETGKEADFAVIDFAATELMERRLKTTTTLDETLFALIILGDDRAIYATHVMGECLHKRDQS
ncbi:MAG: guanine deaminase [Saprospiraceae bacterium]|jgi:guanine deaminase